MLIEARKRKRIENLSNVKILYGTAYNLPFKDEFFDKVYCINTFCHIENNKKAVEEISRVLKKGGMAYIEFYDAINPFVFFRFIANPFFKNHPYVYGNFIPTVTSSPT